MAAVKVNACGPIRDAELELPERGIVVLIGPNLSGKSLLEGALSSAALASTVVADWKLLGPPLAERLAGGEWAELYAALDPLGYLSAAAGAADRLAKLEELVRSGSGGSAGAREYLASMAFAADLSARCSPPPQLPKMLSRVRVDIAVDGSSVRAELPLDPRGAGPGDALQRVRVEPLEGVVGLNVGAPRDFLRWVAGGPVGGPSSLLARILLRRFHHDVEPGAYNALRGALLGSWRELSSYEAELAFIEREGEPAVVVGESVIPWWQLSSGLANLAAHWLLCRLVALLSLERKRVLVGLEEPEAHLDPYVVHELPRLYGVLARRHNVTFVVTTHSEALLAGIENAVASGALRADEVRVYETVGREGAFTLRRCTVSEGGVIEGSRFVEIAWRLLRRRLAAQPSARQSGARGPAP